MRDFNLLLYRFIIFNFLMFSGVAALVWAGYLIPIFETDQSRLTFGIVGLFAVGWCWCLREVWIVSGSLNRSKALDYRAATASEAEKALLKIEWLEDVSEWLVGLGLLGTVIGFSIALSGVDQDSVTGASGAQNAVAHLMQGMRIALNTTLLGASLAIWHEVNTRIFKTAMRCLWIDRVRAGNNEITQRMMD